MYAKVKTEMKQEVEQAINFCIDALNGKNSDSQQVEEKDKFVLETIQKIAKLPYQGRNLGIGGFEYRDSFEDMVKHFECYNLSYSLAWKNAILVLYDFANYTEIQMLESAMRIVNDNIIFNHILEHIITNLVVMNDIESAEKFIPNFKKTVIFKEEDNFDIGYLVILKHFALKGDDKNFFKYFKQSKPAANKTKVHEAKEFLVSNFTTKNGIEEAIALCNHKNLGVKYYFSALMPFAEQGKYQELKQIFEKYSELKQIESETELKILTHAYLEARKLNYKIDDDFEQLFDRAIKVDRKLRWGDFKLQDSILFDLGLASLGNKERVLRCRKAIKNNSMKQEFNDMTKNG